MARRTIFYETHRRHGGKMVDFAGFDMPVEYSGVSREHINVRENAGIFDVSHMGEIWVKGSHAKDFVQKVTSNDVNKLTPGKIQYSCFPNEKGGIVDDLLVYHYEDEKYLLVVNASNIEKDYEWLKANNTENAILENASELISQLAVQGPNALKILQKLTTVNLSEIEFYSFKTGPFAGLENVIISATGYTGAGGFELYFYSDAGPEIWDRIMEAGEEYGIEPAGLAARDTLRLEMGYCLYGNDINDETSPVEAGLGWITKINDNNPFIGKELFARQKEEGVSRKLVGFEMIDRGIPRQHYVAESLHGENIGEVTSGTMSPSLKKGIGLAYLNTAFSHPGSEFVILVRNKKLKAKVVKPPFINK